jgi:hypothetical protein
MAEDTVKQPATDGHFTRAAATPHKQRFQGDRAQLCTTGCLVLFDSTGKYIGRSRLAANAAEVRDPGFKRAGMSMAASGELLLACRVVEQEYRINGSVSLATIDLVAQVIKLIDGAA